MGLPKRRHSKTRRDSRRANWKLLLPGLVLCPQCHEPKQQHRICKSCGFYKNRTVLTIKE